MTTKKQWIANEVARAVGAGKLVALETVNFSDPNRPKDVPRGGLSNSSHQSSSGNRG